MKKILFLFLITTCYSADYIRITKEYNLSGTSESIGPGYFYTDKSYRDLLGEIQDLGTNLKVCQIKLDSEKKVSAIQLERIETSQKAFDEYGKVFKMKEDLLEERKSNEKELLQTYVDENRTLKKINRYLKAEKLIYQGLFFLSSVGLILK